MFPIHRHCPHVMYGDGNLPFGASFVVTYALQCAALRSGLPPSLLSCMKLCPLSDFSRIYNGRVPFPLGLSPFAPEMLFSRGGFGIPLPHDTEEYTICLQEALEFSTPRELRRLFTTLILNGGPAPIHFVNNTDPHLDCLH